MVEERLVIELLAQAAADTSSVWQYINPLNIGLAGVGLVAFLTGWIVPGKRYEELDARLTRAEHAHDEERARWHVERSEFAQQLDKFTDSLDKIGATLERIDRRAS